MKLLLGLTVAQIQFVCPVALFDHKSLVFEYENMIVRFNHPETKASAPSVDTDIILLALCCFLLSGDGCQEERARIHG